MKDNKTSLYFAIIAIAMLASLSLQAQSQKVCFATISDGDTIPMFQLREINVIESHMLVSEAERRKNKKLIRNTKKMLPYAKEGKRRLDALELQIANMPKKDRKEAIKKAEAEILAEYKEDLKKCTFSQGKVLLKLIDRETGRTSYTIVNELRGKLRASFYQVFAKLFGYSLKSSYNPRENKDDELLERIVRSIEIGQI